MSSLLDVISYLLYIGEKDYKERLEYYQHSRNLSKEVAMREYLECFPDDIAELTERKQKIKQEYDEAIEYFRTKHGSNIELKEIKKKCLGPRQAGESLKDKERKKFLKKMYKIVHRRASEICHGERIDEFISTPISKPMQLEMRLGGGCTKESLLISMCLFFFGVQRINELLKIGKDEEITNIDKELNGFLKNSQCQSGEERD